MAIKTKLDTGTIDITTGDTVIFTTAASTRIGVSAFTCYASAAATVTFYSSPDDTSAAGDILAKVTFATDDEQDISAIIGLGFPAGQRIIAVGSVAAVNATMAYAEYTGDSV